MTGFDEALTPAELDALPVGSTVVDDEGQIWISYREDAWVDGSVDGWVLFWRRYIPQYPYDEYTSYLLPRKRGPVKQVTAYGGASS